MAEYIESGDDFSGDDFSGDDFAGDTEVVSGDDFSGDDFSGDDLSRLVSAISGDDFSGARGRRGRPRGRGGRRPGGLMQKAIATREVYTKSYEAPLGFDSVSTVAAGATYAAQASPQVPFKGSRLTVPSSIAGLFLILDLKVGKNSVMPASGANSALVFSETGVGVRLSMPRAAVSQLIVLSVQNISGGPSRFFATLIGETLELDPG